MPIIQTRLTQSDSSSPEDTTLYVYNMSLFLVTCLLNRCQRASSAGCLQSRSETWPHHEARSFPFPTTQMPLTIRSEIKEQGDSQDCWHNVEHCVTWILTIIRSDMKEQEEVLTQCPARSYQNLSSNEIWENTTDRLRVEWSGEPIHLVMWISYYSGHKAIRTVAYAVVPSSTRRLFESVLTLGCTDSTVKLTRWGPMEP
jgi:hypothetical protein